MLCLHGAEFPLSCPVWLKKGRASLDETAHSEKMSTQGIVVIGIIVIGHCAILRHN